MLWYGWQLIGILELVLVIGIARIGMAKLVIGNWLPIPYQFFSELVFIGNWYFTKLPISNW